MKLQLKEWIAKVTALLNEPILVRRVIYTYNGSMYGQGAIPQIDGYTAIGVVGWQAGGSTAATINMFDINIRTSEQDLNVACTTPTAGTSVVAQVLYIRTELWGGGYCLAVFSRLTGVLRHRKVVA